MTFYQTHSSLSLPLMWSSWVTLTQFSVPPFPICRDNRNSSLQISDSSSEKWHFIRLNITAKIYQHWIITVLVGNISPVQDGDSSEKGKQKTLYQLYHNNDNKTPKQAIPESSKALFSTSSLAETSGQVLTRLQRWIFPESAQYHPPAVPRTPNM